MAVNRHRSGPYVAVQLFRHTKGPDVAINRNIHGSQHAHTQQSDAHGPYVAVVRAYKR